MHALHTHLSQTLADKLAKRRVVVWYDERGEFKEFVAELAGGDLPDKCRIDSVDVGGSAASLCVMQDSFFEAKFAVESIVAWRATRADSSSICLRRNETMTRLS